MKHYLDLIKISAKRHRKQNRMTRLCIVLAVFLVTVIFGMADMEMRSQYIQAIKTDGSWHAAFAMEDEQGALLRERPEVEEIARYGTLNYHLEDGYQLGGVETGICGFDREFQEMLPDAQITEGTFPENAQEIALNENAMEQLEVQIGEAVDMTTPQGERRQYRITGVAKNTALTAELDAFCVFLSTDGFLALHSEETEAAREGLYFVRFRRFCNIQKAIDEIEAQFGLTPEQVRQNVKVLMMMLQTRDSYLLSFYLIAGMLAVLVVIAGILMITASMNSSIVRRTEFFGMLRCLGATRKQVVRFVRREALGWCKGAIPAGVAAGTVVIWGLCWMLRFLSPGLFDGLPVFGISYLGIGVGIVVGFITVLLAARSPAKRAAGVSPLMAVSGNAGTVKAAKRAAHTRLFKVDMALGIHHASGSKKNFLLVTGSFAFSIILFLGFSTAIDFMNHAVTPLRPSAPDIAVNIRDGGLNQIPPELVRELEEYEGVKNIFKKGYAVLTLPADERQVVAISYDELNLIMAEDLLIEGRLKEVIDGEGVLSVFLEENTFDIGSSLLVSAGGKEQEICVSGVIECVSDVLDYKTNTMICSEELFQEITGEKGYTALDIQLEKDVTDGQVKGIRRAIEQECGSNIAFSDKRMKNQETKGAYYSMSIFLYGFLGVIALIAFFNIINCIAMSVSAQMREYGAMRAIGMTVRQLIRMVFAETLTYTVFGVVLGCLAGVPLNWFMFRTMVTNKWGEAWTVPAWEMAVIVLVMASSVCLAVLGPVRRIKGMTVVDTISRE